jgi:DNA modification methylase
MARSTTAVLHARPNAVPTAPPRTIDDLKPWARNPREIDQRALSGLKNSLADFGDLSGIVFNTKINALVSGHQRIRAIKERYGDDARLDGDTITLPSGEVFHVRFVSWDEAKHAAACMVANNPNTQGDFTDEAAKILRELKADPTTKESLQSLELLKLLEQLDHEANDQTRTPEAAAEDVTPSGDILTQPGDFYQLGKHRLLCADSTVWDNVKKLTGGKLMDLVFTDPPYGVSYEAASGKHEIIAGDGLRDDKLLAELLTPALKNMSRAAKETAGFYIWHATSTRRDFEQAMVAAGIEEKQYLIWIKDGFVMGRSDYQWQHEPCFYGQKYGGKAKWNDARDQSTVWRISLKVVSTKGETGSTIALGNGLRISDGEGVEIFIQSKAPKNRRLRLVRLEQGSSFVLLPSIAAATDVWSVSRDSGADYVHPTQKPAALAMKAVKNSTVPGDSVLDLFAGSGSTLVACELTGRQSFVMELDPAFCDAIVTRWCRTTGLENVIKNGKQMAWPKK